MLRYDVCKHVLFRGQAGEESRGHVLAGDQAFPAEASHKPGKPSALARCGPTLGALLQKVHTSLSFGSSVFHSVCSFVGVCVCVCVCAAASVTGGREACWWRLSC